MSDAQVEKAAFDAMVAAEDPDRYVTDPDEVEALRRRFGYLPRRRRWPSLRGGLAPGEVHP